MDTKLEMLDQARRTLVDLAIKFGPRVATALLILVAGIFAARWAGRILQRWLGTIDLEPPVRMLFLRGRASWCSGCLSSSRCKTSGWSCCR